MWICVRHFSSNDLSYELHSVIHFIYKNKDSYTFLQRVIKRTNDVHGLTIHRWIAKRQDPLPWHTHLPWWLPIGNWTSLQQRMLSSVRSEYSDTSWDAFFFSVSIFPILVYPILSLFLSHSIILCVCHASNFLLSFVSVIVNVCVCL